jgi:ferredoxin
MNPVELSLMAATPQVVTPGRCLLQRNYASECRYCLDACPTQAVKFELRQPAVDVERCLGCGLCLVACPVECFETGDWSERSVVSALVKIGRPSVELACKSHPAPAVGNENSPVVQVNTCLAALSPGLWFEIGLKYHVKARLEYCSDCPMKKGAGYVRQAVSLAGVWLDSCRQGMAPEGSILVQDGRDDPDASRSRVVVSAERPIISRRDFLFGFARSSGPVDLALTRLPVDPEGEEPGLNAAPHVPAWLRRMAEVYPDTASNQVDDGCSEAPEGACIHWPTMTVSEKCVACLSCSLNCPSGALVTKVTGSHYEHLFTPGLCVACGLCAQVCPHEALVRSYRFDNQPFTERIVAERPVGSCLRCGRPALQNGDGLCFVCANEPALNPILEDARNRLFHT